MKPFATLIVGLLLAGSTNAGDVYVTTDAKGHKIYTDAPQTVPARKLDIRIQSADSAPATEDLSKAKREDPKATPKSNAQAQPATQASAVDRAANCAEARLQDQMLLDSLRVYKLGPNGEAVFLTAEEMSAARVKAKQYIAQFCTEQ